MRISKKVIDGLPSVTKDTFYWDEDFPGFGIKTTPKGRRVFVLQTRLNGQAKRYTIGVYGQPWTPDTARVEAKRILGQTSVGHDPHEERTSRRQDITVTELASRYWEAAGALKKPTTVSNEKGLQQRHINPLIGKVRLKELQRHHLQKFLKDIAEGKTKADVRTKSRGRARVSGGKGAANRTLGLVSSMLSFAVDNGLLADNPALGIKKFSLKTHDRYLSGDELERLGQALSVVEKAGANSFAVAAIRFLALSGCRRNEALTLQWKWLDFEHGLAKLPDSKTGQKVLLLGREALNFLQTLPKTSSSPLIFPSSVGGVTPLSIQKVWVKVREEAGLEDVRLHDLRHNFASSAVSSGQSLYIVAKLLGHSQPSTTQRYAHLAPDPLRSAADLVAADIASKMK